MQSWTNFSTLPADSTLLNGAVVNKDGSLSVAKSEEKEYTTRPTLYLTDSGLSLSKGMTISFSVKNYTTSQDCNILSLASDEHDSLFAVGSSAFGDAKLYFDGSQNAVTYTQTASSISDNTEYTFFTLTSETITTDSGDKQYTFSLYRNGVMVAQAYANRNTTAAEQEITRLTLGGWSGDYLGNSTTALDIENLAIYDGSMTADNVKYLYQTSIPEPATATLSLLALAGLAARRRRK